MYQAVLFDFDGTLTPSLDYWLAAYRAALAEHGVVLPEEVLIEKCFYRSFDQVEAEFNLPVADPARRFGPLVEHHLAEAFLEAVLFPQAEEVLQVCKRAGLATGLVTSSFRRQVDVSLAQLKLADYFDVVVTGNDVTHYKPHPEPLQMALTALGQNPAETLMVGDTTVDILAGKAAGTRTALFLPPAHTRFYDFERLRATGPDFVFSHHSELLDYLNTTHQVIER